MKYDKFISLFDVSWIILHLRGFILLCFALFVAWNAGCGMNGIDIYKGKLIVTTHMESYVGGGGQFKMESRFALNLVVGEDIRWHRQY